MRIPQAPYFKVYITKSIINIGRKEVLKGIPLIFKNML
jgi:hypothetical protein